ncbi:S-adenosyl-L-methionine-dependent methyltransferase [Limtongia smithiae]|uniref:S-adenosyl-L-methionine-dependent methyltransferase n=1 Tax=Limtongia smithiae TaxID=1125753 RepID=UPI0034CF4E04
MPLRISRSCTAVEFALTKARSVRRCQHEQRRRLSSQSTKQQYAIAHRPTTSVWSSSLVRNVRSERQFRKSTCARSDVPPPPRPFSEEPRLAASTVASAGDKTKKLTTTTVAPAPEKAKLVRPQVPSKASQSSLRATSKQDTRGASLSIPTHERLKEDAVQLEKPKKKEAIVHDYSVRPYSYLYFAEEDNYAVFKKYPTVTSKRLAKLSTNMKADERPRKLSMLTRDFIDDSLYNPKYGYFSRQALIYSPEKPFEYGAIANADDFVNRWSMTYKQYDNVLSVRSSTDATVNKDTSAPLPQLWHTPTELFQPFYGQAIAKYLLLNYLLTLYPYNDLVIYEVGGGNGTLMLNILDYIRESHPDVYERTRYNIIEISGALAEKQLRHKLERQGFSDRVRIINKSIFDWTTEVPKPCFFIALEVFDNFAHDTIRYDHETNKPYQGYVVVDDDGNFQEHFSPELDPLAARFMKLREEVMPHLDLTRERGHPLAKSKFRRKLRTWLDPLAHDLTTPEFIPTRYLQFLDILKRYFPEHRLLASDFTTLPNAIPGYNSPVVQVMLEKRMIPVETYMVLQGYFDILFPTDFELAAAMYEKVVGKIATIATHSSFLEQWADIEATTTKDGENPMVSFYQNAAFMCT